MKLFGFPLSPFVRKAAVAAAEKGLAFEWEPSNPRAPTDEFLAASPFSKIPALQDGGFTLADSTAIVTYLDTKYPQPPLLPAEPEARGRAVWFEELADTVMIPAGAPIPMHRYVLPKIVGVAGDEQAAQAAEQAILRPFSYLEATLQDDGWLDREFSVGDIAVACGLRTLEITGWKIDAGAHPKLAAWYGRVSARPAWQQVVEREAAMFGAAGL